MEVDTHGKGLTANGKVPTSSRRISTVEEVEQHPLQSLLARFTYPLPEARQLASLGELIPPNLVHPDSLPGVTNHSGRAQKGAQCAIRAVLIRGLGLFGEQAIEPEKSIDFQSDASIR
jgi:hypothetical protein